MNPNRDNEAAKLKRLLGWYNAIPSVIWSAIHLVPISVFCYTRLDRSLLYVFIFVTVICMFLPNSFFDKLQLGKTTATYKKLGVGLVNKVTQNGALVNSFIKKKFPNYKAIKPGKLSIRKRLQQTYGYEKFHFAMFVFFTLTTIFAASAGCWGWAVVLSVSNLLYNIYPNLLQRYVRLKLQLYTTRVNSV